MHNNIFEVIHNHQNNFYLVLNILEYCSFTSLAALSRVNRALREIVLIDILKKPINRFVGLYIPDYMIVPFFELLASSKASMAGSVVRCIISNEMAGHFKHVDPVQLDIIIPNSPSGAPANSQYFRKWKRFVYTCGYYEVRGTANLSENFRASISNHSLAAMHGEEQRKISLIESKDSSVFPPLFQASQTSSFYLMSATRIYCLYPKLHDLGINLSLKPQAYNDVFDRFNYGLYTSRSTEEWQAFCKGCGEACPSVHRFTKNYPGWVVLRWGGFGLGKYINGPIVPDPDPYDEEEYAWKLEGECTNQRCPYFLLSVDLYEEAI